MADDTDFLTLYDELGLAPGVSDLDALKQAYRRRVAQLHPDRGGDDSDPARLQRLNRLYGAALAFEQRYGRLPAAPLAATNAACSRACDCVPNRAATVRVTTSRWRCCWRWRLPCGVSASPRVERVARSSGVA